MNKLIFPIAIHSKATTLELTLFFFLVILIFVPFTYGIFAQKILYCLSLPIGFFGLIIFNFFTEYKFTTLKIIQQNKFICFNEHEVQFHENEKYEAYNWNEIKNIELNIIAHKNKREDEDTSYQGIENYVAFTFQDIAHKQLFYIETAAQFNFLTDYFKKTVLPKLYLNKNIKNESIIISKLDYTELQQFKAVYNINRYTDFIYFNK